MSIWKSFPIWRLLNGLEIFFSLSSASRKPVRMSTCLHNESILPRFSHFPSSPLLIYTGNSRVDIPFSLTLLPIHNLIKHTSTQRACLVPLPPMAEVELKKPSAPPSTAQHSSPRKHSIDMATTKQNTLEWHVTQYQVGSGKSKKSILNSIGT